MRLGAIVVAVLLVPAAWSEDKPKDKPLTPAEAAKKVDENVTVEMEVRSAGKGNGVVFLNSEADFKDAKNFTIFLDKDALAKFKKAKIEDPADYYEGKTIQVKGKVTLYQDKPQIAVRRPDQIEIVDKK